MCEVVESEAQLACNRLFILMIVWDLLTYRIGELVFTIFFDLLILEDNYHQA